MKRKEGKEEKEGKEGEGVGIEKERYQRAGLTTVTFEEKVVAPLDSPPRRTSRYEFVALVELIRKTMMACCRKEEKGGITRRPRPASMLEPMAFKGLPAFDPVSHLGQRKVD
jgi:hypothetical protein